MTWTGKAIPNSFVQGTSLKHHPYDVTAKNTLNVVTKIASFDLNLVTISHIQAYSGAYKTTYLVCAGGNVKEDKTLHSPITFPIKVALKNPTSAVHKSHCIYNTKTDWVMVFGEIISLFSDSK
jgi:hypothetical protein